MLALYLSGCSTVPRRQGGAPPPSRSSGTGAYYQDDGPGENPPPNLDKIPNAVVKAAPLNKAANSPYVVFGRRYVPDTAFRPYRKRGIASWYGRKFNGLKTSSGEVYDMYAMTAAHRTLPIPSYARVTNLGNHKSVVVRINDRGPFLNDRLIDLSYTAAYNLGILRAGHARVEVDAIDPAGGGKPAQPAPRKPPQEASVATAESGIYLQLAAFSVRRNAENFGTRMKQRLGDLGALLHILSSDGLFRVKLGPYPSRAAAAQAAAQVKQAVDIVPLLRVR